MPPKPNTAAINATIKKVRAQPSMVNSSWSRWLETTVGGKRCGKEKVPMGEQSRNRNRRRALTSRIVNRVEHMAKKRRSTVSSTKRQPKTEAHASWDVLFSQLAFETARLSGKPAVFLAAAVAVVAWALSGPLFGFSDTWQLVINTSTTIVTFLMVFLIQNTQNRDTLALQLKLAELIFVIDGAQNKLATAEDLSDEDLEWLHENYRQRCAQTLDHLDRRRKRARSAA
jgi:low affinity Fe/Cu permease